MTDNCPLCQVKEGKIKAHKVFENDKIMAIMHPIPAHKGHIIVFPKDHQQIISQVDEELLSKMYVIAQKLSSAVFDSYGAQGTNVLIQNGEAAGQTLNHFCIHVLPRTQADGINLEWQPKQADEQQLSMLEQKLLEATKDIKIAADSGPIVSGEDNYMIKDLKRIP